jgi:hypothetical protein
VEKVPNIPDQGNNTVHITSNSYTSRPSPFRVAICEDSKEMRNFELLCLTKHHAMKVYWGVEIYLHAFFDLGTRWRRVVSFTFRPLYPQRKNPWYPLDRRLAGNFNQYKEKFKVLGF